MFKSLFNRKKNPIVEELEKEAEINGYIIDYNRKKRKEEDEILAAIERNKEAFEKEFLPIYKEKLQVLSKDELQNIARECVVRAILYIRQLGGHLHKEDFYLGQRTTGRMLDDLSDSIHNFPRELDNPTSDDRLAFELMYVLCFLHTYKDYQFNYLAVAFISLKNAFPNDFLIKEEKKELTYGSNN